MIETRRRFNLKDKTKKIMIDGGTKENGLFMKLVVYALLVGIGFVYMYPILFMLSNALMPMDDLINPAVGWLPTELYLENFRRALRVLNY